jgi:mannan endo-1,6-alpha-mannosidase
MYSYKAYIMRWLAQTTKWAPFTYPSIQKVISASAIAAAQQCSGGPNGRMCGLAWVKGAEWDGTMGVGQQMGALEAVQSNLIQKVQAPVTNGTGGTSAGDPSAGNSGQPPGSTDWGPPTVGGRIGAAFATLGIVVGVVGMCTWMTFEGNGWAYEAIGG